MGFKLVYFVVPHYSYVLKYQSSLLLKEFYGMIDITTDTQNTAIVHVDGKIIGNTVTEFHKALHQQMEVGNINLIIDLTNVPLLDSTALGVIIITLQILQRSEGKLVLLSPQQAVSSILEITRLTSILEVYDTKEAALNAFT